MSTAARITDSPLGPIHHRRQTPLTRTTRCRNGHTSPRYASSGACAVCGKLWMMERYYAGRAPSRTGPLRRFTDYEAARADHFERGGWLLQLGPAEYGCTDNPAVAKRLRGHAWMVECDRRQCWDEVELDALD
jgi:hypothetical protein